MSSRSVSIAYYDPFGVAPHVIRDIQSRLPLRNLHWNHPPRPLRTIATLSVNLYEDTLADGPQAPQHQIPGLLDTPYMRIILVKCEDNDTYRASVRKIIREWFTSKVASQRDSTEWMLFFFDPHSATGTSSAASSLRFKSSVFNKIKADFNTSSKEDRCVLVKMGLDPADDQKMWTDAMISIRDGILDAFGKRVQMYEDEVKKMEAKKTIPGWNFATFFVMKEGLALAFEHVSLLEDALIQYDELDATFMQLLQDNTITFFQTVGFNPDSTPKLLTRDSDSKVRHSILENNISLFDFRCYLFSRQASLLLLLMSTSTSPTMTALRISQFLLRTRNFALETSKMLVSNGKNPFLVANWVYGIIQEVMDATEVQPRVIQGGRTRDVAEGRAELLLLARSSIEQLAARKGWYADDTGNNNFEDVSLVKDEAATTSKEEEDELLDKYLNPKLREIINNQESFMTSYMDLTDSARAFYESADRTRSVDKLRAQMAVIKYHRKEYEAAVTLIASLPQLYLHQGWELISTNLYVIYADCLFNLGRKEEYLKVALQIIASKKIVSKDLVSELCLRVIEICADERKADAEPLSFPLGSLFTTSLGRKITVSEVEEDKFSVKLQVENPFDVDWPMDSISVRLAEPAGMKYTVLFESNSKVLLKAGSTSELQLWTTHSVPGVYEIDNIEFKLGALVLVKDYHGSEAGVLPNQRMRMYQQPGSMNVKLSTARSIRLDAPKRVTVEVHTGWNEVVRAKVTARSASSGTRIVVGDAKGAVAAEGAADEEEEDARKPLEVKGVAGAPSTVEVGAVGRESVVYLTMPYVAEVDVKELYLRVIVEFSTSSGESYSVAVVRHVSISLSLAVNVQDIFKSTALFSKFSISCVGLVVPLRVLSGELVECADYTVKGGRGTIGRDYVAFPKQPVTFSYRIERSASYMAPQRKKVPPEPLLLKIKYRRLEDEMRHTISELVRRKIAEGEYERRLSKYQMLVELHILALMKVDLAAYGFLDRIVMGPYVRAQWESLLSIVEEADRASLEQILEQIYTNLAREPEEVLGTLTKELVIPVEVPTVQVLFTLELLYTPVALDPYAPAEPSPMQFVFSDKVFYVGHPIPITVRLSSSRGWAPRNIPDIFSTSAIEFSYDVTASADNWLISGKKKGHFTVSDAVFEVELLILPLKHGNLLLPTIEVRPSSKAHESISAEVEYKNSAESVLVLPEVSNVNLAVE
ncbi:trafficking protein particle complex subunit 10 [Myxozyma melibiosi]|uniref:Trafficking protein particle complex subunit 10 n=1 Tax=Myxozyma melibiosi TaxID=54550 RepID=A0ABR1FC42_9ASCO